MPPDSQPPSSARLPRLPQLPGLEDYRLVGVLGRGGMGAVFEVAHRRHGRRCALKTASASSGSGPAAVERARQRFQREAELSARLNHPGILKVLGADFSGPTPYLLVDLLPGGSLAERIEREGRLPLAEVLEIGLRLTRALHHAHSFGVVHRDLKPENVLFDAGGQPVLADFGLAVSLNPDTLRVTRPGELIGTPAFMSPEQAVGKGSDDPATDAYALGGLLYAMLLGRAPLDLEECGSLAEVLARITSQRPRSPRAERREVPPELDALTLALLSKEPSERPDLPRVERALFDLLDPLEPAQTAQRLTPLLTALGLMALAGGLGALWGASGRVAPAPSPAKSPRASAAAPSASPTPAGAPAERIATARRLRAEEAPYAEVRALLVGEGVELVRERMELAVARGKWEDALAETRAHDEDERFGRELRLLRAWSLSSRERVEEATAELRRLSARGDRWGAIARTFLPGPPPELADELARFSDCPWATVRRYVLLEAQGGAAARERALGELRRLLERPATRDVALLHGCLASDLGERGRDAEARAHLAAVRRLCGADPPVSVLVMERRLALRAGERERAFELLQQIARRKPGAAHVPLAVACELRRDLSAAQRAANAGLRQGRQGFLHRLGQIPEPRALRVLRYAGSTVMSTKPLSPRGQEEVEGRVAWVPVEHRQRVYTLVKGAFQGLPWRTLADAVATFRELLGHDRRWLELEFALQASRQRAEEAEALARRLEATAPRSEQAEWRLLSVYVRFDRDGPPVLPRFADVAEQFPGTGAATLARCVLRVEREPRAALELLRQVAEAKSAPRCGAVAAGVNFMAQGKAARLLTREGIARFALPHFERQGFLNPQMAEFAILPMAALQLHVPNPSREAIADALRQLELLCVAQPSPSTFALAARLALRLPAGDPWLESIYPWLWTARLRLPLTAASRRGSERRQVDLAAGAAALLSGEDQARVVELWREVPPGELAPWERELFQRRFGAPPPAPDPGEGR